jgi:hypothetical protein
VEPAGVPGRFVDLRTAGPAVTVTVSRAGRCAATVVLDGLRPGRTTFTAKYRAEDGSPVPVFFSDRTLLVAPLAADG